MPSYDGDIQEQDSTFCNGIYENFLVFVDLMEVVKIKDSLRVTMAMSSLCNASMQDTQPWVLAKSDQKRS